MNAPAAFADALPVYPGDFPLPDRQPYSIAVDMGLARAEMAAGNVRQRRLYRNMPQTFALSFRMTTAELAEWQDWVNDFAFSYFLLPLTSAYAPPSLEATDGGLVSPHIARFVSDLAITLDTPDNWIISVAAELSPEMYATSPRPSGLDRIDGLHPADNLPDSIDGGSPFAPSLGGPIDGGQLRGPYFIDTRALLLGAGPPILLGGGGHLQTGGTP